MIGNFLTFADVFNSIKFNQNLHATFEVYASISLKRTQPAPQFQALYKVCMAS